MLLSALPLTAWSGLPCGRGFFHSQEVTGPKFGASTVTRAVSETAFRLKTTPATPAARPVARPVDDTSSQFTLSGRHVPLMGTIVVSISNPLRSNGAARNWAV